MSKSSQLKGEVHAIRTPWLFGYVRHFLAIPHPSTMFFNGVDVMSPFHKTQQNFLFLIVAAIGLAQGQSSYQVMQVTHGARITGSVKWSGPKPRNLSMIVNKDPQVCDPEGNKTVDFDRLVIGSEDGVANTIVFLKNITSGKAMTLPEARRSLDQKHCRYEPHILLVPQSAALSMKSSDPVLHTIHMDGAATFNLPFPFVNQTVSRTMDNPVCDKS
jgi:hypothetical protein